MLENLVNNVEAQSIAKTDNVGLPNTKDLPPISEKEVKFNANLRPTNELPANLGNESKNNYLPATGKWKGEAGNSKWQPALETVPDAENKKGGNPEGLTWEKILDKHQIDGVDYKEGYPDFDPVSKANVEIDSFTDDRGKNFRQADEKTAEVWTKEGKDNKEWSPRDVAEWRKENGYTWHECEDCKTLQLVPKEVHNNTPHSGGIAEIKKQNS